MFLLAYTLVRKYAEVFAQPTDKMSVNNFYEQKIRLVDENPVYAKNYRLPHAHQQEIKRHVQTLMDNDIIESSTAPIILVPKKSTGDTKKWRICIDYRNANKKLVMDKFPIPRIDEVLDSLGRSQYFTVLDLYQGFHQVPLHLDSRDITTFTADNAMYRYKVLPFGLL